MIAIRLRKTGTKSRKQWRIIVAENDASRNGRLIEELGFFNPFAPESTAKVSMERYNEWLKKGARPSTTVQSLMKKVKKK